MKANFFSKLLGFVLEFIGKILKKSHIEWLGHYMSYTGKSKILPKKYYKLVKEYAKEEIVFAEKNCLVINPIHKDNYNVELHRTIGKFSLEERDNIFYLLDKYEFYPWCGQHEHFRNCKCNQEKKQWSHTDIINARIEINLHLKKSYTYEKQFNNIKITVIYSMHLYALSIFISINDKIFENLGKPFFTYAEIPV